jgi:hypothetical protein
MLVIKCFTRVYTPLMYTYVCHFHQTGHIIHWVINSYGEKFLLMMPGTPPNASLQDLDIPSFLHLFASLCGHESGVYL